MSRVHKERVFRMLDGVENPVAPKRENFADLDDVQFEELVAEYNLQVAEMKVAAEGHKGVHDEDAAHGPGTL